MSLVFAPLDLFAGEIFNNVNVFLAIMILLTGVVGLVSRRAVIGSYAAFLVFVYVGSNVELFIYRTLLYVVLTLVVIIMGIRIMSYATTEEIGT